MQLLHPLQSPSSPPEADSGPVADVFLQAAADVRRRIRDDAERFEDDVDVFALFRYLESHLFDRNLDVYVWRSGSGASRAAYDRAVAAVGPLKTYIDELRIAVASRLVVDTDAVLSDIARKVGIHVLKTFRRTFKRVRGLTPKDLRAAHLAGLLDEGASPEDAAPPADVAAPTDIAPAEDAAPEAVASEDRSDAGLSPVGEAAPEPGEDAPATDPGVALRVRAARWRRRFSLGLYSREQVTELRRLLRRQHPHLEEMEEVDRRGAESPLPAWVKRPIRFFSTDDKLGGFAALVVIGRLLNLPDDEMRHAIVHGIRFGQLSGFDLLHELSLKVLTVDVARALKLAELTVETAEAHRETATDGQADSQADWRTLAWAGLGYVRLWAGDRGGAEAAFVSAREEWETPRETRVPEVEIRMYRYEAALRQAQRHYGDAIVLIDHAIRLCDETSSDASLRFECVLERAELARLDGAPETAIEILEGLLRPPAMPAFLAVDPSRKENPGRWMLFMSLVRAQVDLERYDEAAASLAEARQASTEAPDDGWLSDQIRRRRWCAELDQAESRLCLRTERLDEAERLIRASHGRFEKLGVLMFRGLVTAELAAVCAYLGKRDEARVEGEKAAVYLECLALHREARRAARALRALPDAEEVRLDDVEKLYRDLDLVRLEMPWLDRNALPEEWRPEEWRSEERS